MTILCRFVPFTASDEVVLNRIKNANLVRLVTAYRERGHRQANINPLKMNIRCVLNLGIVL